MVFVMNLRSRKQSSKLDNGSGKTIDAGMYSKKERHMKGKIREEVQWLKMQEKHVTDYDGDAEWSSEDVIHQSDDSMTTDTSPPGKNIVKNRKRVDSPYPIASAKSVEATSRSRVLRSLKSRNDSALGASYITDVSSDEVGVRNLSEEQVSYSLKDGKPANISSASSKKSKSKEFPKIGRKVQPVLIDKTNKVCSKKVPKGSNDALFSTPLKTALKSISKSVKEKPTSPGVCFGFGELAIDDEEPFTNSASIKKYNSSSNLSQNSITESNASSQNVDSGFGSILKKYKSYRNSQVGTHASSEIKFDADPDPIPKRSRKGSSKTEKKNEMRSPVRTRKRFSNFASTPYSAPVKPRSPGPEMCFGFDDLEMIEESRKGSSPAKEFASWLQSPVHVKQIPVHLKQNPDVKSSRILDPDLSPINRDSVHVKNKLTPILGALFEDPEDSLSTTKELTNSAKTYSRVSSRTKRSILKPSTDESFVEKKRGHNKRRKVSHKEKEEYKKWEKSMLTELDELKDFDLCIE